MAKVTGHGVANYLRSLETPKSQAVKKDNDEWPTLATFGVEPITEQSGIGMSFVENPTSKIPSLSIFKTGANGKRWGSRTFAPPTLAVVALAKLIGNVLQDAYGIAGAKDVMSDLAGQALTAAKKG